jgi:hypothetical protein
MKIKYLSICSIQEIKKNNRSQLYIFFLCYSICLLPSLLFYFWDGHRHLLCFVIMQTLYEHQMGPCNVIYLYLYGYIPCQWPISLFMLNSVRTPWSWTVPTTCTWTVPIMHTNSTNDMHMDSTNHAYEQYPRHAHEQYLWHTHEQSPPCHDSAMPCPMNSTLSPVQSTGLPASSLRCSWNLRACVG